MPSALSPLLDLCLPTSNSPHVKALSTVAPIKANCLLKAQDLKGQHLLWGFERAVFQA
ncbi:hypothetical protein C8F04DRAFT_1262784 [Mycena alexandri]|uniref:Uncharacterized protein n=1 Tax=Mycena alexandri TaxID=1745969 RepID=A0AAD6SP17_9AGAR|nr:hypothetical protein C8F04DRAFT_1262784 [Mycena alexandri]